MAGVRQVHAGRNSRSQIRCIQWLLWVWWESWQIGQRCIVQGHLWVRKLLMLGHWSLKMSQILVVTICKVHNWFLANSPDTQSAIDNTCRHPCQASYGLENLELCGRAPLRDCVGSVTGINNKNRKKNVRNIVFVGTFEMVVNKILCHSAPKLSSWLITHTGDVFNCDCYLIETSRRFPACLSEYFVCIRQWLN